MKELTSIITSSFGPLAVANLILRYFGCIKIPMIGFVRPKVIEFSERRLVVKVPLRRRSKNHLGTMYFGALATGADLAGGVVALNVIYQKKLRMNFVFKEMRAEFMKRVEGDAHFVCDDVQKVSDAVELAASSQDRVNVEFAVSVLVPSKLGQEPAARFHLVLSLKNKNTK